MEKSYVEHELAKFDMSDVIIAELQDKFLAMKVSNPEDKENYTLCVEAHKVMKKKLSAIEGIRVDLKADSLAYGKLVDTRAKKWREPVKGIVDHLGAQRKVVEDEEKRIKEEKERVAREEAERLKREEEKRLADQKEEQDKKDAEQQAAQDKLDEERRQFEEDKRLDREKKEKEAQDKKDAEEKKEREEQEAKDKKEREEKEAKEAKEAQEQEAKDRAEREAKENAAMEAAKLAEEKRQEELKPDKEKLTQLATEIRKIKMPLLQTNEAFSIADDAEYALILIADNIDKAIA